MLDALHGRIDRKTYIIGNLLAFGLFLVAAGLIMVPLAILDLAINNRWFDDVIGALVYAVAFPAVLYYIYFCVLMIKRAHDFNWPGLLLVIGFTLAVGLGRVLDIYYFNFLAIIIIAFFCLRPGHKSRNNFGPAPRKKFKLDNLKINF